MYSELVCVGADGKLYQWKWEDPLPFREQDVTCHPRVKALGLVDEKSCISVSILHRSFCSHRVWQGKTMGMYSKIDILDSNGKVSYSLRGIQCT